MKKIKIITKNGSIVDKIKKLIERIRPSLQIDGGDIEFVDYQEKTGVLQVKLTGRCAHCPMSQMTLKFGVEKEIKHSIPEVKKVIAI